MASARIKIYLHPDATREVDRLLMQIDALSRGPAITKVLRDVGNHIKKSLREILPKPGYPGDKPELVPLRDTVKVKIKNYQGGAVKVMIVGYENPEGAHGHLVEFGHEKWLWGEFIENSPVDPHPYLQTAINMTANTRNQVFIDGARAALAKAQRSKAA
jgi:hypothetical protein